MKTILSILFILSICVSSEAQQIWRRRVPGTDAPMTPEQKTAQAAADAQAHSNAVARAQYYYIPRDPWRIIEMRWVESSRSRHDIVTNYAKGLKWEQFCGTVKDIGPDGVTFEGWHGPPCTWTNGAPIEHFTVHNFPYPVKLGDSFYLRQNFSAYGTRASFDYGKVTFTPGTTNVVDLRARN